MYRSKPREKGFNEFLRDLNDGNMSNVVFLYGIEKYLINWACENIEANHIEPETKILDMTILDGEEVSVSQIIESAETYPLLSCRHVIFVRELALLKFKDTCDNGDINRLIEYIKQPNPESLLVITCSDPDGRLELVKAIKKYACCYMFGELKYRELASFAAKRFRSAGIDVSQADLKHMIDLTGYGNKEGSYSLYNFENDINKMIAMTDGGYVSPEIIDICITGDDEKFIFDLIDAVSSGRKNRSLMMLNNRMSSGVGDEISVMSALISQIEVIYSVREMIEKAERSISEEKMSAISGIHPYRIKKIRKFISKIPVCNLRKMLIACYNSYEEMLTGQLDHRMALEFFIAKYSAWSENS